LPFHYITITVENKTGIFNLAILSFRHSKSFSDLKNILKGDFWATLDVLSRQKPEDSWNEIRNPIEFYPVLWELTPKSLATGQI